MDLLASESYVVPKPSALLDILPECFIQEKNYEMNHPLHAPYHAPS